VVRIEWRCKGWESVVNGSGVEGIGVGGRWGGDKNGTGDGESCLHEFRK
jgi:hypothetical protein